MMLLFFTESLPQKAYSQWNLWSDWLPSQRVSQIVVCGYGLGNMVVPLWCLRKIGDFIWSKKMVLMKDTLAGLNSNNRWQWLLKGRICLCWQVQVVENKSLRRMAI